MGEHEYKAGEDKMSGKKESADKTLSELAKKAKNVQIQIGTENSSQTMVQAVQADLYMIYKGDIRIQGSMDKIATVKIVGRFLKRVVPGIELFEGESIVALMGPQDMGDAEWMLHNVFKKLYMVGLQGDKAIDRVVDRAIELYESCEDREGKAGFGILKLYLDKYLMKYDIWRP